MRFGERRTLTEQTGAAERLLFRLMGVADPAHYLHFRYLSRALDELTEFRPSAVLDAGCGRGDHSIYLARRYPDAQVVGVDVDEGLVASCRRAAELLAIPNLTFQVGDLTALEREPRFDLVVSIDVLEHIRNQDAALSVLASALRPGGAAYYHVPTVRERPVPFSSRLKGFHEWAEEEHVAEEQTAQSFVQAVAATGLQITSWRRTFGFFTGELATSLFALPFENTPVNRVLQGLLAPLCRVLSMADILAWERTRYAVAVLSRQPSILGGAAS